ncbi:M48 family metallopeptidase [Rhodoferax saidenbachensis]|uniref:Zn-dependent protease with chaperone function n=1 Tax=Rhodoferax saidenbachensis TaxID=1484693 RepID=A0ABU1ZM34_9BURK|nr:M48 family metallopeptidase [Rhodoferax saidenbachensis]MDR7306594.1 Zn-dependent protease with chaperone function [Rhodoferax saidenbachensis]
MNRHLLPKFSRYQKTKLALLAVFVEVFFLVFAFIPAAFLALLSAAVYGPKLGLLIGVLLFIGVAWFIQPDPVDDRHEMELPSNSDMHKVVDALARQLKAPKIHRIVLDDSFNAAAHTSSSPFYFWVVRRKLVLGAPLLQLLKADEVKAVIAHELGHFSAGHDRLGQWIYRVQYKWGVFSLMSRTDSDNFVESVQKLMSHRLVPFFLRQSSAWSHQCEYEADASTQSMELSQSLINALAKMEMHAYLWQNQIRYEYVQWQLRDELPSQNVLEQMAQAIESQAQTSFDSMLAYTLSRPRRLYDTHPRLHERAGALSVDIQMPDWTGPCAGETLLNSDWKEVFGAYKKRWFAKHRDAWRFAHFRLRWLEEQVKLRPNERELRAIADATFIGSSKSLEVLRNVVQESPGNSYLHYELGCRLLDAEDDTGLHHLQESIKLNKKMAVACLRRICEHHTQRDSITHISRSLDRLAAAHRWVESFYEDNLWSRFCSEPLGTLPEEAKLLFADAVGRDSRIDGCWVGSLSTSELKGYQFKIHLIVFRLDSAGIHEPGKSEEHVRAQLASLLKAVCKPDELVHVKSVLWTEPLNPHLLRNLDQHPGVCVVQPQLPVNQDILRIGVL